MRVQYKGASCDLTDSFKGQSHVYCLSCDPYKRNQGHATKLLRKLRLIANIRGIVITLTANQYDPWEWNKKEKGYIESITQEKLVEFYKKSGFEVVEMYQNGRASMKYTPKNRKENV